MANHIPPHIQTLLRKHPTWAELSAKYILYSEKGVTMQEFCSKALEDPTKIAPSLSAEFMISTLEVSKAEAEIDKFLTSHNI